MIDHPASFTPGPWIIEGPDEFGDYTICEAGEPLAIAAVVNGEMRRMGGKTLEHKANARLIAAAPDLYAALEALFDEPDRPVTKDELKQKWNNAKAALDKAREG